MRDLLSIFWLFVGVISTLVALLFPGTVASAAAFIVILGATVAQGRHRDVAVRVLLSIFGLFVAVIGALVALLFAGTVASAAAFIAILGATIFGAWFAGTRVRRLVVLLLLIVILTAGGFLGYAGMLVANGILATSGPSNPADPTALASATTKIEVLSDSAAFRLELTDAELTALVQEGLRTVDAPLRSIDLDFVASGANGDGGLNFVANFKNGTLSATGTIGYALEDGDVKATPRNVSIGLLTVPPPALSAIEDVVSQIADVNQTLRQQRVTVQSLQVTDDALILIGTSGNGKFVTSSAIREGVKARAAASGQGRAAPAEANGPGEVNATEAPGSPLYVALGDSLAANEGAPAARDGYVSRFHRQLQTRDGKQYGLRNFGISGETSGTMRHGQLEQAIAFMQDKDVAYVTIDLGANDLLPHLGSQDCAQGAQSPACRARIDASLSTYRANLTAILPQLRTAAPEARLIFLLTYNPFSFGFAAATFEADSDQATSKLNDIAAQIAREHGLLIADGFTPMRGLATVATHMADAEPDIHPLPIGYDILTTALLAAQ